MKTNFKHQGILTEVTLRAFTLGGDCEGKPVTA